MQLRGIDTNLVIALRALLVHGNVTRAAKEVGLSQSSMSHSLARLRQHFGDALLVPVGRQLVLTDRARSLVGPVTEAVEQLARVFSPPERFEPKTSRRVFRIAATDNLELYVLPGLLAQLEKQAPHVEVRVCPLPDDWTTALLRGNIDLKLGRKYAVSPELESEDLSSEEFACVVRRGHPLRGKPSAERFAALHHLLIAPTANPSLRATGPIDTALAALGLSRHIMLTVPHFLVAPFVVARTDLVLTAPARLLAPFEKRLALRRLLLPVRVPGYKLSQVWAKRTTDDEAQRWLRAAISRAL